MNQLLKTKKKKKQKKQKKQRNKEKRSGIVGQAQQPAWGCATPGPHQTGRRTAPPVCFAASMARPRPGLQGSVVSL
jgi:hypothetical protein